ncbi:unnamed protein product [Eruca vesicaria subsp. sativa]|uniref:Peptidase M16 N-terminal domain-containing protein n=1 Tax=Eruca vesicaria subsp. sativa TaxID=29727 RepID=A0ABC8KIH5_ERUVS|nr:unnamed protein product [Eruca vesicaria subsp. sativa]
MDLPQLFRSLRHARYASSSAVATSSSSPGFFSWLTGGSSTSLTSLDMPLNGVSLPLPLADHVEPSKLKIITLPNGLKIASEMSPHPAASIGLYVDCGSIYEAPYFHGATHLLERMAFKSTTKELKDVAGGKVNQKHLDRAKAATKSAVLMNLESRKPVKQFLKTVDGFTLKDITDFTSKIISKPLTMGSFGDVLSVPSYDTVSNNFS